MEKILQEIRTIIIVQIDFEIIIIKVKNYGKNFTNTIIITIIIEIIIKKKIIEKILQETIIIVKIDFEY